MRKAQYCTVFASFFLLLMSMASQAQAIQGRLAWDPPTTNADGTPLQDLAGYILYYGYSSGNYAFDVDIGNQTSYALARLPLVAGQTYYFTVTAYDTERNESEFSNEVSLTVPETTIYVAYDSRAKSYPTWLTADFTATGDTITTTDVPMTVWRKDVPVGPVTLPGNLYGNPRGVSTNYFVFVDFYGNGSITDLGLEGYQVGTLTVGDTYYIDRKYTITGLPTALQGLTAIKTANDDKRNSQETFLTFTTAPIIMNVTASSGRAYKIGVLGNGTPVYIDRDYTWTLLPAGYEGAPYILTANDDRFVKRAKYLSFEMSRPATVYVVFDVRIDVLPAWLDDGSWTLTEDVIDTSGPLYLVYGKHFPAGTVVLGGNSMEPAAWGDKGRSNYSVIVMVD